MSAIGFSVMSDAEQVPFDAEAVGASVAGAVEPLAPAVGAVVAAVPDEPDPEVPDPDEPEVPAPAEELAAGEVGAVAGEPPDPAPALVANSTITTTTSRSTSPTISRRFQYTELGREPTGCLNDDMQPG
ncbi:hypothetical protein GCM10022256_17890 [Frondihabitans peucedani]|uniref:Uncharacterized protein n=1 Tax=Frondihabitans peucedani TaxID=598626 RepID=A0ABP8E1V2_9MICO